MVKKVVRWEWQEERTFIWIQMSGWWEWGFVGLLMPLQVNDSGEKVPSMSVWWWARRQCGGLLMMMIFLKEQRVFVDHQLPIKGQDRIYFIGVVAIISCPGHGWERSRPSWWLEGILRQMERLWGRFLERGPPWSNLSALQIHVAGSVATNWQLVPLKATGRKWHVSKPKIQALRRGKRQKLGVFEQVRLPFLNRNSKEWSSHVRIFVNVGYY